MDTESLWKHITKDAQKYPELNEDLEVDVVIVGGGITGLTAAWHLLEKSNKKVVVLEADRIGNGTTGYSTGNLYVAVQPYYQTILSKFNEKTVSTIANSRKFCIDYIENIVKTQNLNCNFVRRPMYLYATQKDQISFLTKEYETLKKANQSIEFVESIPLPITIKKAFVMKDQARFNPLQYVVSLAKILKDKGCLIFEKSRIIKMEEKDHCVFYTEKAKIKAKKAFIATHTPIGINPIQMFIAPYRSYAVSVKLKDNKYPDLNCWNLEKPHYAISTHSEKGGDPDTLVVAGSHHKTGQSHNALHHFEELENYLNNNYPVEKIAFRWSAQHYQAADDIPYIGLVRHAEHTYQATGYFADGLVYGTLGGILVADEILNKDNVWKPVYKSRRFDIVAEAGSFIKENTNVFFQYMKDLPSLSKENVSDVKPGEGKVLDIKGRKCGVYRDINNTLHVVSAVCTHMKCIVGWNNAEKTWDCPCHGSRFSHEGKVIEGPALLDLEKREEF